MSPIPSLPIVAVDVGNSRIKFGRFDRTRDDALPWPQQHLQIAPEVWDESAVTHWLTNGEVHAADWFISRVHHPAASQVLDWLAAERGADRVTVLSIEDFPLEVKLEEPHMVGIDRLAAAVAVNRLREPARPAVVVDAGSAITVDAISPDGAFLGGAILPGIGMAARALYEFTDQLPQVSARALGEGPPALGTTTDGAIRSGLFWGAVGAVGELIDRLAAELAAEPEVYITGGGGEALVGGLRRNVRWMPHLTLSGIAIAATHAGTGP